MLLKSPFTSYNSIERKGLVALLSIIVLLQLIYFFYPFSQNKEPVFDMESPDIIAFQKKVDSLKQIEIERRKPKIHPFNPSFLSDYRASKLGMSIPEIDRLLAHRKAGKYINSAIEFQRVTQINDSLLSAIKPYFKFPDRVNENKKISITPFNPSYLSESKAMRLGMSKQEINRLLAHKNAGKYINSAQEFKEVTGVSDKLLLKIKPLFKFPDWVVARNERQEAGNKNQKRDKSQDGLSTFNGEKQDLNTATAIELQKINGIGEKMAKRILTYRKKLKGYSIDAQLREVWYLKPEVADRVLARFTVITTPKIEKININTAQFKEVLHLPYIDYELTKKMFEFRDEVAELQSLEELKKIDSFPVDKFERISLYLKAE